MSTPKQPRLGTGRFQWNAGGWFGAVLGATAWMVVTAAFLIVNRQVPVATVPIGCFFLTNLIACVLWIRRGRLDPFYSLMVLLAVISVTIPVAWIATRVWASPETLAQMNWPSAPGWNVAVVLLAPGLMAWFYFLERRAKFTRASDHRPV